MSIYFSGREILEIAIGIEKNGYTFYDTLTHSAGDADARNIYGMLASREVEHMVTFKRMLKGIVSESSEEPYSSEEYALYLKALVDSTVFTNEQMAHEKAKKVKSDAEAINIALAAEKDSILFYHAIQDIVSPRDRKELDKIIEEERSHVKQLSDLRKSLSK